MKLLILTTVYPRGLKELPGNKVHGKFVRDLAKAWVTKGYEVHVLTPHSTQTYSFERLDGIYVHRFHYFFREQWETLTYGDGIPQNIRYFKNKLLVPCFVFAFILQALHLIRKYKISVVNAHWAVPTGLIALWLKYFTKVKVVTTIYGAELFPVIAGRMQFLKSFLKHSINQADIAVGISQTTVEMARQVSKRDDIYVLPDGIDVEYYQPGAKNKDLLQKYHVEDKLMIFFTGRMVERKGHHHLLEAMCHVSEVCPDTKLILGGKGPFFEKLVALQKDWNLQDKVELPGFIPEEEMVPLLQSADLFVLPSCIDRNGDTEGSATAALEAMACGTPAIIGRVGGNIGAVEDGCGAFYFESGNVSDLAEKILGLLKNPELLIQNKAEARKYVVYHYTWSKIVETYIDLLVAKEYSP